MKVISSGVSVTCACVLAALVAASCSTKSEDAAAHPGGSSSTNSGGSAGASSGSGGKAPSAGSSNASGSKSGGGGGSTPGGSAGRPGSGGGGTPAGVAGSTTSGGANATAGAAGNPSSPCADPGLVWKSANKTNYESYPDPGSPECIEFNGCTWEGQFAACDGKKPEAWVKAHDIVAAFPDFKTLELHDLCLRKGNKTIVVTVLDTCGDSDCDGCCTENRGDAEQLIDLEKYTNERWGVADGRIEWADLGPTRGAGCD